MSLFDKKLLGTQVQKLCPDGYVVRPLEPTDFEKGFLNTLSMLTVVGDFSRLEFMGKIHKEVNNE